MAEDLAEKAPEYRSGVKNKVDIRVVFPKCPFRISIKAKFIQPLLAL